MSHRVSLHGSYRIDRRFRGVGRIAVASGATTKGAYQDRLACLTSLSNQGRLDVLQAVKGGRVTVTQVYSAHKRDAIDDLMASLNPQPEHAAFWPSVWEWLGPEDKRGATAQRYASTFKKLERIGMTVVKDKQRRPVEAVADLGCVDWPSVRQRWVGSAADRNHLRRALGKFLTDHLGDVYDPLRRIVVKRFRRKRNGLEHLTSRRSCSGASSRQPPSTCEPLT